jgi:pyruvate/2-oxoglutarate dehydrogenase complex dihydrolipoamide dehydrogenase (E3) component
VVIGTGSRAVLNPIPGLGDANPLTHIEALELCEVPEHLLVIGAGYVGLEFSQAMRRFGSRVTVIDRNSALLHHEDHEVTEEIANLFRDEGVDVVLGARVKQVSGVSGDAVSIVVEQEGRVRRVEGTHVLVAAGRVPNTEGLASERAGVELTSSGHIKVNERLETTAPGVWAVGDVTGNPQFTHIGFDDFRIVHENMNGGNRTTSGRLVPFCLYTDPELARVGLNEKQATHLGVSFRVFSAPMTAVMRAYPLSEKRGFLKALVGDDDRILGFTAFGVHAGEVMSAVQLAMVAGMPYTAIRDAILAHPTATEGLIPLFSSAPAA